MKINELIAILRDEDNPNVLDYIQEAADTLQLQKVRIMELETELKRTKAERRWIPVTERLPEIGDQCIVAVKYKYDHEKQYTYDTDVATYTFVGGYIDDCWDTYNDWDEGQQFLHVTHWMPMPEMMKEVTNAEMQ